MHRKIVCSIFAVAWRSATAGAARQDPAVTAAEQRTSRSFADPGTICRDAIATHWNRTVTPTVDVIEAIGVIRHD
jgi:hypothetical protein